MCCKSVKLQTKNLKMFSAFLYFSSVFNTNLRALYILNLERWYCCWEGSSLSENHNIFSYHALIDQFVVKIKFISIEYKTPLRYQNVFFSCISNAAFKLKYLNSFLVLNLFALTCYIRTICGNEFQFFPSSFM